jgi:hypothetical protein
MRNRNRKPLATTIRPASSAQPKGQTRAINWKCPKQSSAGSSSNTSVVSSLHCRSPSKRKNSQRKHA